MTGERVFDLLVLGGGIVGLWTARRAAETGLRVAVVEIGPRRPPQAAPAQPPLTFPLRKNIGAVEARNHVLTGNSAFWGGGLIPNPPEVLEELFPPLIARSVGAAYSVLQAKLGIEAGIEESPSRSFDGLSLGEIVVLPGRRRGIWSDFLSTFGAQVAIFDEAIIEDVSRSPCGALESVRIRHSGGLDLLRATHVALSMGVIDSILFVQQWLVSQMPSTGAAVVGRGLHDHWSIPVAHICWRNGTPVNECFPPTFRRGGIVGRRLSVQQGFFHITANYDEMPPYNSVKSFMRACQQSKSPLDRLLAALTTMRYPWLMLRAGLHYLVHRSLRVPDGACVTLTLDFESCGHPDNRLVRQGSEAVLAWDLHPEDVLCCRRILEAHGPILDRSLRAHGLETTWLTKADDLEAHLHRHAIDAYHLGGGLAWTRDGQGATTPEGTLQAWPNVFINSAASFPRPGTANPVLTLLARAEVFVQGLVASEVVS